MRWVLWTLFLLSVPPVGAQTTAVLQGNVNDSSGAAVSGASITVHDPATGFHSSVLSDADGRYRVAAIPPGTYQVTIARAGSTEGTTVARPMNVLEASAFQALNPKGWIFAFGAVTTFRPAELSAMAGSLAVAGTMMIVILPCAAAWAVAGGAMSRLLSGERAGRAVSLVLGGLVAVSVIAVWL